MGRMLEVLNPLREFKVHPPWFTPFGKERRDLLYNGALFQMMLLGGLFGSVGYLAGRKPLFKVLPEEDVESTEKAIKTFVKLPGSKKSEISEKEANDKDYAKHYKVTSTDKWIMGGAPIAAAYVSALLMYNLGSKQRRRKTKDEAEERLKESQRKYDKVLQDKLYGTSTKEAKDKWVFEEAPGTLIGLGGKLVNWLHDTAGIKPAMGALGIYSFLTALLIGKAKGDSQSKQRKKMKDIRKYVKSRQAYRFVPKLTLEGIDPYEGLRSVTQADTADNIDIEEPVK